MLQPPFADTFFLTISCDIATSIHSFLLQKVAMANTASFAGVFWFIITFLLGGQPGRMLQCAVTSPLQPVILTAVLTPAPHRPGLHAHPGLGLAGSTRVGCPPRGPLPRTSCAKIRDSWNQGLELGLLGPSIDVALSSTAPHFAQQRQRKRGKEKKSLPCSFKSGQNRFLIKAALNHRCFVNAGLVDIWCKQSWLKLSHTGSLFVPP